MTAPALDTLPEWPWPRWEFVAANFSEGSAITVALAPLAWPDPVEVIYDGGEIAVDWSGRTVDSTGHEASFDG